ncbi:MAG: DUF72 domain-containing protein [Planctomycetota bacterium]
MRGESGTPSPRQLRLGTAGWSYKDWVGAFYPDKTKAADMLSHYVRRFNAVELDSSFYGVPEERTVDAWCRKVPVGFLFCPKFPQEISHQKFLVNCEDELSLFLSRLGRLGTALGPMLLQFPYFRRDSGVGLRDFLARLEPFLDGFERAADRGMRLVVEVRNKSFLRKPLVELLRSRSVALGMIDHPYMPEPDEILEREDLSTCDFSYLRLLGDRYAIERIRRVWDREILDQGWRVDLWTRWIQKNLSKGAVYVFANNHFAGHAPATMNGITQRIRAVFGQR